MPADANGLLRGDRPRDRDRAAVGQCDGLTCEASAGSAAAYALGALDRSEADRVEAHLRGCSVCRQRAALDRRVVALLALAPPVVAPPATLRSRLLAAVRPVG